MIPKRASVQLLLGVIKLKTFFFCSLSTRTNYAAASGLNEAGYFLQRARMSMIEAHASRPSRQIDIRAFFDP